MDSEALTTFLSVHRSGSVSAAALKLSRTQSAISRRLAVLEAQAGLPLFERVGRRMVLSDAGRALLPYAERVAAALDDAKAAADRVRAGSSGTLRLAVVGTLADARLAAALQRVRAQHPEVDLRLRTATSAEVSALVRAGEATLGLRYFADRADPLQAELVFQEPLVVACAPTHRLAGRRIARLAQLAGERWLAFADPGPKKGELFARSVFAQFLSRGVADLDWVAIDSLTAQKRLVEAGLGLALIQASAIDEEVERERIATVRVADLDAAVPVVSVTRPGAWLGAAGTTLLAALREAAAKPQFRRSEAARPKVQTGRRSTRSTT